MSTTSNILKKLDGMLIINGKLVAAERSDEKIKNPATGEIVGMVGVSTAKEVDAAVNAARGAFLKWGKSSPKNRTRYLHRIGELIEEDSESLAEILTMEQGKPLKEAHGEILKLAETFHFYAEEAVRINGETIPNDSLHFDSIVIREPIGVVAAITPWNYPAELVGWKLCAALAAGCTIVVKPAEITPFTALAIGWKCTQAALPPGVVNVVTGSGSEVGQALVENKLIDKIAFTGSSEVGLRIQKSATSIKKMSLELGGNCPLIVTANANIDDAVKGAIRRSFRNCGQICIAINRIYVDHTKYNEFITKLASLTKSLVVANGLNNPEADLGAIASEDSLNKTKKHLEDALIKGARLVAGGSRPVGTELQNGRYFLPTVLVDCNHEMDIMKEETFGPIVGVSKFSELSKALKMANDTPYGLAAYVFSKNIDEIKYLTSNLDYGNVAVNNVDAGIINAPYGGRKQSGIGYEHGREGMLEYTNFKHIRTKFTSLDGG